MNTTFPLATTGLSSPRSIETHEHFTLTNKIMN